MRKKTLLAFTMLSLIVGLAVSISAQSNHNLVVTIPFAFSIRDKTLSPGEYMVRRVSSDKPEMLSISRVDGGSAKVAILTSNVRAKTSQNESMLVFIRYGDQYFLSQIWEAGESEGRELIKSKEERRLDRELSKNRAEREKVAIVGRRN